MYSFSDFGRGISNPRSAVREVNRLYFTRGYRRPYNTGGIDIFAEDWDTLILLDACRYDYFEELIGSYLDGTLEHRISRGSSTKEFVLANFQERSVNDTVYTSANPWYLILEAKIDSEIHAFTDLQSVGHVDYVIEELNIPSPASVTKHARIALESYPKKRHIIHHLQPHHPFIGKTGLENFTHQSSSLHEVLRQTRGVNDDMLRRAYVENLGIVLSEVGDLVEDLHGRTVISSDHGEMLGERHRLIPVKDYGHHIGIYNETLVKIPWFVIENGPRREIISEPGKGDHTSLGNVDERLRNLGYKI